MALATAAALHDLRPLILGDDALNLQQEVIFRAPPDRLIQKNHLDAAAFKELDPIPQFKATAKLGPYLECVPGS